jgi:hypothetical protein
MDLGLLLIAVFGCAGFGEVDKNTLLTVKSRQYHEIWVFASALNSHISSSNFTSSTTIGTKFIKAQFLYFLVSFSTRKLYITIEIFVEIETN